MLIANNISVKLLPVMFVKFKQFHISIWVNKNIVNAVKVMLEQRAQVTLVKKMVLTSSFPFFILAI